MPKPKLPPKDFEWNSDLAYVIGLLVTDGNLSRDGRHITMRSAEKDMLRTFKKCLGLKNKIGFTGGQRGYRVQFGSVQFYKWLLKIGLFPAKSYTIGEIDVPDQFFRDYFRGCLDGDGNIQINIAYQSGNLNLPRKNRYNSLIGLITKPTFLALNEKETLLRTLLK